MRLQAKVTTIIPTYRRPYLLRRAIRSVLDQSYSDFKICVYDNASGDETGEVVQAMASQDPRIHYHCHAENIGPQDNFIYGLAHADTQFVHLISDDDFLLPGFFGRAVSALEKHPRAAFFSGGILSAKPSGRVRGFARYGSGADELHRPPKLFHILAPFTRTWTSAMFRRSSVEGLGGLKKVTGYSFSIDLILRSATRFEAVLSDLPCAVFMFHAGSSSVAEVSEAFESLLNLEYFRSINDAVESSLSLNCISESDAHGMKELFQGSTERCLFQGALAMITRGNLLSAVRAAEILSVNFKRRELAAVIRASARKSWHGSVMRIAARGAKAVRSQWIANRTKAQYAAYSELVRARMLQLDGQGAC